MDGYYALCNGQLLEKETDQCELSQEITISEDTKFSFWYYMYGRTIGTLELKVDNNTIWSKTGRQENAWVKAEVDLSIGTYKVNNIIF